MAVELEILVARRGGGSYTLADISQCGQNISCICIMAHGTGKKFRF